MSEESKIYYRTKLLSAISEKNLSDSTGGLIIQCVVEAPDAMKEKLAEYLLNIVKNCGMEEEIITKVKIFRV